MSTPDEMPPGLQSLGELEPGAEASAAAIGRVRATLLQRCRDEARKQRWRMLLKVSASVAAILCISVLACVMCGDLSPKAFAEMQRRVAQSRSVEFEMWADDAPDDKCTVRLLDSGMMREDYSDGGYCITDFQHRRMLQVDPEEKEATLIRGLSPRMQQNLFERIRDIHADAIETLPPAVVDGRSVSVYRARLKLDGLHEEEFSAWVDRETLLPVRMESKPVEDEDGPVRTIISNLKFDQVASTTGFSTEPPPGMTLTVVGLEELRAPPTETELREPELRPGHGINRLRLGAGKTKAIALLGKPDQEDSDSLDYYSRGYSIQLDDRGRVEEIDCYTPEAHLMEVRAFGGKTTEGIRMGSKRDEVEKAYGTPEGVNEEDGATVLDYPARGLVFTLKENRVIEIALRRAHR